MGTINLLYKREYAVNKDISVVIPTVGDVLENEDQYYTMVSMLTATPYDMMVQLDDIGIDYTEVNEYELFLLLFTNLKSMDTKLLFGDLNLSSFRIAIHEGSNAVVLVNDAGIVIDRVTQNQIAATLRKIHHIKKNTRRPGNEDAKDYLLKREREKQKRRSRRQSVSQLESLVVALVNTEQFKYDYNSVRDLTIYQFNESLHQIIKKVEYDNRMYGVYSGAIKASDLSQDDLNWLTHK